MTHDLDNGPESAVHEADVVGALRGAGCVETFDDEMTVASYSSDASNYRRVPAAVVFPRSRDEVIAAVGVCRELALPITCRGAGTSTAGQATGTGVVLDFSRHYNRILSVDPHSRTATVEPGVVADQLQEAVRPLGLLFGPDPSTHSRCTIGGMVGNNACGSHSLAWGRTVDNVVAMEVLTYDGTVLQLDDSSRSVPCEPPKPGDAAGRVLDALNRLVNDNLALIRTELGRFPRQVSGYALEHLLPERGFDVARALVGSEGTCAIVLSVTVRLVEPPQARRLVVLGFSDACAAADAVPALLDHGPIALEGLDRSLTDLVRAPRTRDAVATLPNGAAWLFVEIAGRQTELGDLSASLVRTASTATGFRAAESVDDADRAALLWRVREDGAGLATRLPDGSEAWPGIEDAAVPPHRLGAYLRAFFALLDRHRLRGAVYGHFGEGCLHVRVDFDFGTDRGHKAFKIFMMDAAKLISENGGSLSGEHGDGLARSELLSNMYSPAVIALFASFKRVWDPANRLNPGIITDPRPIDADLRIDPQRAGPVLRTSLPFRNDQGDIAIAVRRCVGVGRCRTTSASNGIMCPSYRVTRDEKDSTRGRARVLYEMTQGETISDGWRSEAVREALDLCLSCKGCSVDCPVGVDVATYKSEFLYHHYKNRIRPASHYSMGWLPVLARLGASAPRLANGIAGSRAAGLLKRMGGVAPQRQLPRFADESFLRWFRARPGRTGDGRHGAVLLWVDTFGNYFTPEVLRAGVRVLEAAGYRVEVLPGTQCCGLTWITTGQLDVARRVAGRAVAAASTQLSARTPVVVLEPSCAAALKSDLPELLDGDPAAARLASNIRTLAEFLDEKTHDWLPPARGRSTAISQVHCHQHATGGYGADARLLAELGVETTELAGCCGLAGNFGFEAAHYDVSIRAGEETLLPAVRSADLETLILADGFSCRTQIGQTTARRAVHLAELIAARLPPLT